MSLNNKIGVKCLDNLHLRVSEKGILEEISNEDVEEENSEEDKDEGEEKEQDEGKEKEDEKEKEKEDHQPVPTATNDGAKVVSKGEHEEAGSKGEISKEEEDEDLDDDTSSDEEVWMPTKKEPFVKQRKSIRLASKRKRPVVSLDDDSSTHTSCEPKQTTPSPKPDAPPSPHIPSPPSPIPCTPPPTTTSNSPGLCFTDFANPSVSTDPILDKLQTRLSAKLDTVEVQTEYVDEDEPKRGGISEILFAYSLGEDEIQSFGLLVHLGQMESQKFALEVREMMVDMIHTLHKYKKKERVVCLVSIGG
ncbi:uncharacterized protein LOC130801130 [Amaranthus tricolor]|uniref:uncharacterized protein LOC130801130 n=1 Tax=Amaranthus tricolor TaxID=29722 RepID=UPI00258280C3|nr:uncharacterized protein LOC130801130 [Amaranthus tricolor]